jgi:hypothetical protein
MLPSTPNSPDSSMDDDELDELEFTVQGLKEGIFAAAARDRRGEVPFWDMLQGFYHAVNWTEPWIIALLASQLTLFVVRCLVGGGCSDTLSLASGRWLELCAWFCGGKIGCDQVVMATRRMFKTQVALLLMMTGAARCAETLNSLGAAHWRSFATQDYFDPRGVFLSVLFSGPIVLTLLALVVRGKARPGACWRGQCRGMDSGSKLRTAVCTGACMCVPMCVPPPPRVDL